MLPSHRHLSWICTTAAAATALLLFLLLLLLLLTAADGGAARAPSDPLHEPPTGLKVNKYIPLTFHCVTPRTAWGWTSGSDQS
jgi:hypothetical protein